MMTARHPGVADLPGWGPIEQEPCAIVSLNAYFIFFQGTVEKIDKNHAKNWFY
ncbi:hypothetical protein BC940DRAFT_310897 [Gongronella butleri]|nr:hypothetical protein BC940DRAFT_310897 [Gongronella butleri]